MSICTACAQISPTTQLLALHPDVNSLRKSSQSCPLCRMILDALKNTNLIAKAEEYRAHEDGKYELVNDTSVTVSINSHQGLKDQQAWILIISCGPLKREDFMNASRFHDAPETWLGIYAEEGSAAARVIRTRPLAHHAGSEESISLMKQWMQKCVNEHEKCQWGYIRKELDMAGHTDSEGARLKAKYSEEDIELPTRIIDVQAFENGVKLVEGSSVGGKGSYIALSHVWGRIKHFKTESTTYQDHLARIPLDKLPKTFRDAVDITRKLNVRYLWIDSICIIQDSSADWEQEASRMASVYMNAYVTLSATFAEDGNGGLYTARPSPPSSITLDFIDTLNGKKSGTWTIHNRNTSWSQNVRRSVLSTRAWTLQEKQLARRTLHFAADQVSFECNVGIEFETQRPPEKTGIQTIPFQFLYWAALSFRGVPLARKILLPALVMQTWIKVVEDYTMRKLTYESDKLPALEGLATYVADLTDEEYCYGLWRPSLHRGLMWRTAPYSDAAERRGRVQGRAPTWSWASMNGRVYFASDGSKPLETHSTDVADIIDLTSDGRLTISGPIILLRRGKLGLQGQWDWNQIVKFYKRMETMEVKTSMHGAYEPIRSSDHRWFGFAALDENDEESHEHEEVEALLVRLITRKDIEVEKLRTEEFKDSYLALVIRAIAEGATYKRIGMAQVFLCEGSNETEIRNVVIV